MEEKRRQNHVWCKPQRNNSINNNERNRQGNINNSEGRRKRIKLDYRESDANSEVNTVFDLRQKLRGNADLKLEESNQNSEDSRETRVNRSLSATDLRHKISRQSNNSKSDEQNQIDSVKRECFDGKQNENNETQYGEINKQWEQINSSRDVNTSGRRNEEQNLEGSYNNNMKGRIVQMSKTSINSTVARKSRSALRNSETKCMQTSKKECDIANSYGGGSTSRKKRKRSHRRERGSVSSRDRNRHREQINSSHGANVGRRKKKEKSLDGSNCNNSKGRVDSAKLYTSSTNLNSGRKSRSTLRNRERLIHSHHDSHRSRKERKKSISRERRHDSSRYRKESSRIKKVESLVFTCRDRRTARINENSSTGKREIECDLNSYPVQRNQHRNQERMFDTKEMRPSNNSFNQETHSTRHYVHQYNLQKDDTRDQQDKASRPRRKRERIPTENFNSWPEKCLHKNSYERNYSSNDQRKINQTIQPTERGRDLVRQQKPSTPCRRQHTLDIGDMRHIAQRSSGEIIHTLINQINDFENMLQQTEMSKDLVEIILTVLSKCSENQISKDSVEIIMRKIVNSTFLGTHVTFFFIDSTIKETPLLNALGIFKCILEYVPKSGKKLFVPLHTIKGILQDKDMDEKTTNKVSDIEEICRQHIQNVHHVNTEEISYKLISIVPTEEDIQSEKPSLKPLQIQGKYKSKEHLLEAHFMLLREDFIRPLRKGIEEYRNRSQTNSSMKNISTVKIYNNVKIVGPKCSFFSICHTILFDISEFRRMRWKSSKRLMEGSLLCLSLDNFKTLHFATVTSRKIYQLERGMIDVKFVNSDDVLGNMGNKTFTMVESDAYFESYCHILKRIQSIDDMPFQSYLVSSDVNAQAPKYILDNPGMHYKIRTIKGQRMTDQEVEERKIYPLIETTWPAMSELGLDSCQYEAMKSAITQEVALIQGPPGTGKTYIGLKIMQFFLLNKQKIKGVAKEEKPILVVCYTNHALDQFLEGITTLDMVSGGIVRIGGGCKSETISECTIRCKRKQYKMYPLEMKYGSYVAAKEKQKMWKRLSNAYAHIEVPSRGIVNEQCLKAVMGKHYNSILDFCNPVSFENSRQFSVIKPFCNKHLFTYSMLEWLLIDDSTLLKMFEDQSVNKSVRSRKQPKARQDDDFYDEYGAEYFERQLDLYEFEDEKFRKPYQAESTIENIFVALFFPADESDTPRWLKECKDRILNSRHMSKREYEEITNIWRLSSRQRWRVYNYWVKCFKEKQMQSLKQFENEYTNCCSRVLEILEEKDKIIMEKASVIGMTTTGVAKYQHILQEIQPKIIIVEEAAEILEAHVLTTLNSGCEHLVLIGDHKQLRPKPACYDLGEKFHLKISLFERLILNGFPHVTLREQHRMRPEISLYMRHIYKDIDDHDNVKQRDNIKGIKGNVCFIGHTENEDEDNDLMSKSNFHEAKFIGGMVQYLLNQGYQESSITILTPYMGQVLKLRKFLPKISYPSLRITAVDNFQGEENDIILMSLVRSNNNGEIGFVRDENRICVSLSRAKMGMYVIGNFQLMTGLSPLWKKIIDDAHENGQYKHGLEVFCENHPQKVETLMSGIDFSTKVPSGGCNESCSYRLKCGHTCKMKCHPNDREHVLYKCKEKCGKQICDSSHKCQEKCHFEEICGPCTVKVNKKMIKCNHMQKIECCSDVSQVICLEKCSKVLDCDHLCKNKCGQDHVEDCEEIVEKKLYCGHTIKAPCHMECEDLFCKVKCRLKLKCGHTCVGTCGDCLHGRIHLPCKSPCERPLVCGHICKSVCSIACPPCESQCENMCSHSRCEFPCGRPCVLCREPCEWSCKHAKCEEECSDICTRERCNEPCNRLLSCGHKCIGLCGEMCPQLCKICNKNEVEEIFFGTEEDEDAKFIEMRECKHLLEVSGLDQWIDSEDTKEASEVSVNPKTCPKCKTPIKRTQRYHSAIQKVIADVNIVKKKIWGNPLDIIKMEQRLENDISQSLEDLEDQEVVKNVERRMREYNRHLSKSMLTCLINIVKILAKVKNVENSIAKNLTENSEYSKYLIDQVGSLKLWCSKYRKHINEQETGELQREFQRLSLFEKCCQAESRSVISYNKLEENLCNKFDDILKTLKEGSAFSDEDIQRGNDVLKLVYKKLTGLEITEEERIEIVQAIGLKKGAWYKCPNGHFYCIGECGGAMEESRCPECKDIIGGKSHTLADGNQHAAEMDGSRHAAWSDQANLENYDLENLDDDFF